MNRVLIDTNIILDFALERENYFEDADKILKLAFEKEIIAFITATTVTNIFYFTSPITALVIDDERLARKDLISLLSAHPSIRVVGEADNVAAAIEAIGQLNPEVIFLDMMQECGAFMHRTGVHCIKAMHSVLIIIGLKENLLLLDNEFSHFT